MNTLLIQRRLGRTLKGISGGLELVILHGRVKLLLTSC